MVMEEIELRPGGRRPADPVQIEIEARQPTPVTFSELYERDFLPLVRLATLMTGRVEAARDIVQDAFVKLHVRWATVRNPPAYVRTAVVNGCRSYHRREGRRRRDVEERSLAGADDAAPAVDHTLALLDVLTHRQRAVVVLKFYADMTEREIADAVGCRPGSVGPTLQRALAVLRDAHAEPAGT